MAIVLLRCATVTALLVVAALLEYLNLGIQKNMMFIDCIHPVNTISVL